MKYYLHDTNSFNDEKITELFMKHGYEGLGLFYTLLEKVAFQEKPIKTVVLKTQLKVGKRLEKCWKFMESIGLIYSNNGETFNEELLKFSEKYQIKKEKTAKRILEWRDNQEIEKNVTRYEHICNTPKVNIGKVKEKNNIKDKSEIPILTPNDKFLISLSDEWRPVVGKWLEYKKEKNQPYKGLTSLTTMFEKLKTYSNGDPVIGAEIIEKSIANNYSGFFRDVDKTKHAMVFYQSNKPVKNF
jgi:hypothetical protein